MILDNLGSHKGPPSGMPLGPQAQGCSSSPPDVTPIDKVFARLKHLLRKAAERSKDAIWRSIGYHLDQVSPKECEPYSTIPLSSRDNASNAQLLP